MLMPALLAATMMAAPEKAETDAIFKAAGAKPRGGDWVWAQADPDAKLRIDLYRDLNGDKLVDVVVVEESALHGPARQAFALVVQGPKGTWRSLFSGRGVPEVLDRRQGSWPDIRISGSGTCSPVMRWDGRRYQPHRHETALGKPCTP